VEKINSRKELIELLKDTRAVEIRARESYIEDIDLFRFPEIKIVIKGIKKDEDEHIEILEELIAMLETSSTETKKSSQIIKPLITSAIITLTLLIISLFIISSINQNNNSIIADSIKNR
jgi:rubrerythrin